MKQKNLRPKKPLLLPQRLLKLPPPNRYCPTALSRCLPARLLFYLSTRLLMLGQDPTQGSDRDFVEYIVKKMVNDPDAVEVTRTVDEMGVLITLKVAKEDMGRIIGKNGQTAKSVRVLLRVVGSKNNARVNLKIIEPDGREIPVPSGDFE